MAARPQAPGAGDGAAAAASPTAAAAALKQHFPGREAVIDQLAAELCRGGSLGDNLLVYGPPAAGKTAVVRALLRALRLRHAYVHCAEGGRPRALLASALAQLKGGKRQREEGYDLSAAKCEGLPDFRLQLPGVVGRGRGPCWLVLDGAERLACTDLLAELLRARESTGAELGVLLIGAQGWGSGRYVRDTNTAPPPRELCFPAYKPQQLQQILEHRRQRLERGGGGGERGDAPAFRQFLSSFVPAACRASNNLLDLQAAVARLFPLYMQPLREGRQMQAAKLYARISREVQQCIQGLELQGGAGACAAAEAGAEGGAGAGAGTGAGGGPRRASSSGLAFELPYVSKFLLLAAYVASRNRPTSDRAVFDPTLRKRGRRDAQAHDRQVEAALEAKLRGPHAFALERLLHIFYVIFAQHDAEEEGEGEGGGGGGGAALEHQRQSRREARHVMQQAEVLQQVSSLVALRLLEQSSGDVLEGQLYRCNMGEEAAQRLAANVGLALTNYLKLA